METKQIFQLIPKVMAEIGPIEKASRNEQQRYAFRGIDDVMGAFSPILSRHKLFYVARVLEHEQQERESSSNRALIYTFVKMQFTLYAPDGSSLESVYVGEAMDSGDKSTNKAMSAALKYFLLQTFCVPVDGEDDADRKTHDVKPKAITPNEAREQKAQAHAAQKSAASSKPATDPNRPAGKRGEVYDAMATLINVYKIPAAQVADKMAELCDGARKLSRLDDAGVEGMLVEYRNWIDALEYETEKARQGR